MRISRFAILWLGFMIGLILQGATRQKASSQSGVRFPKPSVLTMREVCEQVRKQTDFEVYVDRREQAQPLFLALSSSMSPQEFLNAVMKATGLRQRRIGKIAYLTYIRDFRAEPLTASEKEALDRRWKAAFGKMRKDFQPLVGWYLETHLQIPFTGEDLLRPWARPLMDLPKAQSEFIQGLVRREEEWRKSMRIQTQVGGTGIANVTLPDIPIGIPPEQCSVDYEPGFSLGIVCLQPADTKWMLHVLEGMSLSEVPDPLGGPAGGRERKIAQALRALPADAHVLTATRSVYIRAHDR